MRHVRGHDCASFRCVARFYDNSQKEPGASGVKKQPDQLTQKVRSFRLLFNALMRVIEQRGEKVSAARKIIGQVRLAHAGRPCNPGLGELLEPLRFDDAQGSIKNI